jgi:hypothetical protein
MLDDLHQESFAACVNTDFQVIHPGSAHFDLRLIEVTDQARTPQQEAFSVVFHGPAGRFIPQGLYQLKHEALGEFEIFLVPIAKDNDGYQYEAIFNRLVSPKPAN